MAVARSVVRDHIDAEVKQLLLLYVVNSRVHAHLQQLLGMNVGNGEIIVGVKDDARTIDFQQVLTSFEEQLVLTKCFLSQRVVPRLPTEELE